MTFAFNDDIALPGKFWGVLFGLLIAGRGAGYLVFEWKAWTGYRVVLYQHGMLVRRAGDERTVAYSEVDRIETDAYPPFAGIKGLRLPKAYRAIAGGQEVLVIGSHIPNWTDLLYHLRLKVKAGQVVAQFDKLQSGETIHFMNLTAPPASAPQPFRLSLTRDGLRADGGDLLPWADAGFEMRRDSEKTFVATFHSAGQNVRFIAEKSEEAQQARGLIEQCVEANRQ